MAKDKVTEAEVKARFAGGREQVNRSLDNSQAGPRESAIFIVRLDECQGTHAIKGSCSRLTLCRLYFAGAAFRFEPRPITCEACLMALGCLKEEV